MTPTDPTQDPLLRRLPIPQPPVAQGAPQEQPQEGTTKAIARAIPLPQMSPASTEMPVAKPLQTQPSVFSPKPETVEGHKAELARLTAPPVPGAEHTKQSTGQSGIGQIHNPAGRIPLQILDAITGGFFPRVSMLVPGTQLHHEMLTRNAGSDVRNDVTQEKEATGSQLQEAQAEHARAQAEELGTRPELRQTQADLATSRANETATHNRATEAAATHKNDTTAQVAKEKQRAVLAQHGFEENEKGEIVPLAYERMSESQQAVHDLKAAQAEQASATAALRKAQAENAPAAAKLAEARLHSAAEAHAIATRRLGLSEAQFEMRSRGTSGGEALPGAMLGDDNKPVGTAFQQNVRPTGQQRNKADLANSAHEQLQDIKSIVARRPDVFGPLAGRKTDFTVWLGSQDPDAQRFRAARTIAGDHLAGVFGGRSEAALKALDNAIGHFKDNPAAMQAGLEQLDKANRTFQHAGSVKTAGSNAGATATKGPQAGTIEGGYKFKGGDPAKPENWEKVKQ